MIIALALLLGAMIAATAARRPLLGLLAARRDPRVGIVAWVGCLIGVLAAGVAGVVLLALPDHGGLEGLLAVCLGVLSHDAMPAWDEGASAVGVIALVGLISRGVVVARRQARRRRRERDRFRFLVTLAGAVDTVDRRVMWLDDPRPVAFSIGGRRGLIAASYGLWASLDPVAVFATLAHERAHLRGRHQLLVDAADALAAAFPWVPLFRAAPPALRELVEAAADRAAVRRHGVDAVRTALTVLAGVRVPHPGLGMGDTAFDRRLDRLAVGRGPWAVVRFGRCVAAALAVVLMPTVAALAMLLSFSCVGV